MKTRKDMRQKKNTSKAACRPDKTEIDLSHAYRLLYPMHTVLVSCCGKTGGPNIITLSWVMPTSIKPPLVAISVAPNRHSHALIKESREFVVNIPTFSLLKDTLFCGTVSGKDHDKFKETGLTSLASRMVKAPFIMECIAHLECKLCGEFNTGDHTLFIGEIIAAYANKGAFGTVYDTRIAPILLELGGNKFAIPDRRVIKFQ
ncbi:MAG: flavin reductase family protein [Candidatus Bathyarchaeia archaeon]|jgi:flavin reductase (DIM6/NTAB) family NADH-FMN oxidoreductase RutF